MAFPGLKPTFVVVPTFMSAELDPSRDAVLINPATLDIIQSEKGGTEEKPPEGFVNFRNLPDEEFDRVIARLHEYGLLEKMTNGLRQYRSRTA